MKIKSKILKEFKRQLLLSGRGKGIATKRVINLYCLYYNEDWIRLRDIYEEIGSGNFKKYEHIKYNKFIDWLCKKDIEFLKNYFSYHELMEMLE